MGSKIALGTAQMEPAAMAAGQFHSTSAADDVFLEGVVLQFISTETPDTPALDRLRNGGFIQEMRISLHGDNSAFISQAAVGTFSTGGKGAQQLVVLTGDENTFNGINDKVYYDVCWVWEEAGLLKSEVTNNDYIESDQDDNGTYMSLCALNVDDDAARVSYQNCTYGWSEPELYCVLQSPPFWRELQYESESSSSFEVTTGVGDGTENDYNIGAGIFIDGTAAFGAGFLGNDGRIGGTGSLDFVAQKAHSVAKEHSQDFSWSVSVPAGKDHAVVFACPIVVYNYRVWMPEHEMDEREAKYYQQMRREGDPDYRAGDTIPASWQDVQVQSIGSACVSHLSLDDYNELVDELGSATHLPKITSDMLASKTIGDPSCYPQNETELKLPGNVVDLYMSPSGAQIQAGDGETELSYEISDEKSVGDGWHLDGGIQLGVNVEGTISAFFSAKVEVDAGVQVAGDGGELDVSSTLNGSSFSTVYADLPEGTDSSYGFSSNMAVYTLDLGKKDDNPYVIGYTAQTVAADALPPVLPSQLRVFGTTTDQVLLRWEKSDYRAAQSWELFVRDNNGFTQSLGITNAPAFLAEHLDAGTTYEFALRAFTGRDGKGVASAMSPWISATTKENVETAPHFAEAPSYALVQIGSDEAQKLSAHAEMGAGMAEQGATLSYQWQRFTAGGLAVEGDWEDIAGATGEELVLPTLHEKNDKLVGSDGAEYGRVTYYRCVATQRLGANVHSVVSHLGAMVAYYDGEKFPISYELEGGLNSAANPSEYTAEVAMRLLPATREGYRFAGWFLDAAHTQPTAGMALGATGPVTFYAAWEDEPELHEGWNDPAGDGGSWCFVGRDGQKVTSAWVFDGAWYYLGDDGVMCSGWVCPDADGVWYYLSERHDGSFGHMTTGWQWDGKAWYYLNDIDASLPTGSMLRSREVPGGAVGANGKWVA